MMDHDLKPCLAVDTFRQASTDTSGKTALRPGDFFSCLDTFRQVSTDTLGKTALRRSGRIFFHAWLSIPSGKQVLTPQGKQRGGFFFMLGCRNLTKCEGFFSPPWLSIPSGKKVLTPQGKQCCGEVVSAEGIDSQDGRNIH